MLRQVTSVMFFGSLVASLVAGCGSSSASPSDASAGADGTEFEVGSSHCPSDLAGPSLVHVARTDGVAFCIDSSEVTNAHYAAFLAGGVPVDGQSARCHWNATFAPGPSDIKKIYGPACPAFDPAGRADYPVVCVGWCDAAAYCRWAGKRLCENPDGGPFVDWTMPNGCRAGDGGACSQWLIACTGDTPTKRYPYGDTAVVGRCVDNRYPATTPGVRPVKEATMCQGGVVGLFDMSGNAWEWQNDCAEQPGDGTVDTCTPVGGSFSTEAGHSSCADGTPTSFFRNQVAGDVGFRCCADAIFTF